MMPSEDRFSELFRQSMEPRTKSKAADTIVAVIILVIAIAVGALVVWTMTR
jgi:hypothetical protein